MSKLITILTFFSILSISCNSSEKVESTVNTVRPVKYIKVGEQQLIGHQDYTGLAKAHKEASLSFKVGGTINSVHVKVGDRVSKGQVLVALDATDYNVNYSQSLANIRSTQAQIESAQAQMESAKANYNSALSNYKRFEKLYETNSISLSDFERAKSSYLGAQASYKAAQTQIEAAKAAKKSSESVSQSASNQVSYTKLRAPFSGVISAIHYEPNELVGQGAPVLELYSEGKPDVEIGVPETVINRIGQNQKVKIHFNSISKEFEGHVYEIGYSLSGSTYPVTVRLVESDERIRPGMPAGARFEFVESDDEKKSILVPPSAIGQDGKGNFVYVIEKSGEGYRCVKKIVTIGKLTDSGFEILSGVKHGELIASAGLNVLRNDMSVSLYNK